MRAWPLQRAGRSRAGQFDVADVAGCRDQVAPVMFRAALEDVLDPVFGRMEVPPMIVVIPDGWSRWGCGQWVDSPVTGNFEQYVLHDVIPAVDAAYRTIPAAESRGVFGFSSGGFGSWNIGSRNPDVFGALAMLSGDSFLDMTHKFMPYKFFDSIWPEPPNGPVAGNVWSELVYDYSATYSTNPDNPPFYVDHLALEIGEHAGLAVVVGELKIAPELGAGEIGELKQRRLGG